MSMNEELINQIVRRILSDPSLQGLLRGEGNLNGNRAFKAEALVLLNYVPDFPRALSLVQQRWGADYTLSILPSDQVYLIKPELPIGMTWITAQDALEKSNWQTLILPTCSPNTLAKVALGIRDNPICEMVGRQITAGRSVEIVTEYLGLNPQTPLTYRELYEGYIKQVQSFGAKVTANLEKGTPVPSIPVPQAPQVQTSPATKPLITEQKTVFNEEKVFERYEKKFLGDKQAYEFPLDSKILVKQGTVISPLARDTLKLRRIELCIEKEVGMG